MQVGLDETLYKTKVGNAEGCVYITRGKTWKFIVCVDESLLEGLVCDTLNMTYIASQQGMEVQQMDSHVTLFTIQHLEAITIVVTLSLTITIQKLTINRFCGQLHYRAIVRS